MTFSYSSLSRLALFSGFAALPLGATTSTAVKHVHHHPAHTVTHATARSATGVDQSPSAQRTLHHASLTYRHHSYERFTGNSFAEGDLTAGDVTTGEDPVVRARQSRRSGI